MHSKPRINSGKLQFIDLFAGAGGLSEGFIRAGFCPIAHVEMDQSASFTLRTREAFYHLKEIGDIDLYYQYLSNSLSREELYKKAFKASRSTVINEKIGEESIGRIFEELDILVDRKHVDLVIGGPPCQAYSLVGRARSSDSMIGDGRNYLFVYYVKFLVKYKPKVFIFENVEGLLSARDVNGIKYFDMMLKMFCEAGYKVEWRVLSADSFGVLQKRRRVIIVGRLGKRGGVFPTLEQVQAIHNVNDAIGDLPAIKSGGGSPFSVRVTGAPSKWLRENNLLSDRGIVTWHEARPHNSRDLEIFAEAVERWRKSSERINYNELPERLKTHKNRQSFLDRFKVVAPDLPASHTVVAHISKDGNYYIHPDIRQNRSLTPREAARIQSFPDDYFFESATGKPSRTCAYRQIGNAVPVLLAEKIATALMENWA